MLHNDITKLTGDKIPLYDILCAGFPCQSFSMAGFCKNRKTGLEVESKGALFFDLAKIIKETKPKAFILENVKNLLNHDKGNTLHYFHYS
jgi:DNA (cytosine-5)-methyltransferase 1